MAERYPYMRFVVEAAQPIAGVIGVIILLAGTVSSCHHGGAGGLLSFLITLVLAVAGYVVVMVKLELLRLLLGMESTLRQILGQATGAPSSPIA
jgi:hypothetical protein